MNASSDVEMLLLTTPPVAPILVARLGLSLLCWHGTRVCLGSRDLARSVKQPLPSAQQQPDQERRQDGGGDGVQRHRKAGERPCGLALLECACRGDAMARKSHTEAARSGIVDAQRVEQEG